MNIGPTAGVLERVLGFADRFTSPLRVSDYFSVFGARAFDTSVARVVAVKDEAEDTRTLTLAPGRFFPTHRAGQHVDVGVTMNGVIHTRTFSISSTPLSRAHGAPFDVTVRACSGGRVTPHLVRDVKRGDLVRVSAPAGDFVLPSDRRARLLFITAGSGITPVMSMLRARAADADGTLDAVHIHYERSADRLIFKAEIDALTEEHAGYELHRVMSCATNATHATSAVTGHASAAHLDALCTDWRERTTFACGPASLSDALAAVYAAEGLAASLHSERFHLHALALPANAEGGTASFTRSKKTAHASANTPLLLVAERAGLTPVHGCRRGLCHSCEVTLRAGCVRDLRSGRVTSEPGTRIQVCINAAASDVEIDL